jgi:hypothetical protein
MDEITLEHMTARDKVTQPDAVSFFKDTTSVGKVCGNLWHCKKAEQNFTSQKELLALQYIMECYVIAYNLGHPFDFSIPNAVSFFKDTTSSGLIETKICTKCSCSNNELFRSTSYIFFSCNEMFRQFPNIDV